MQGRQRLRNLEPGKDHPKVRASGKTVRTQVRAKVRMGRVVRLKAKVHPVTPMVVMTRITMAAVQEAMQSAITGSHGNILSLMSGIF